MSQTLKLQIQLATLASWITMENLNLNQETAFFYSSTNYLLLQYVLASLSGAKTWKEYDQMSIFPDKLRPKFNHTMFINHGKCSEYTK